MSKKSYGFFSKIFSLVAFMLFGLLLVYMYITKGNIESLVKDKLPDKVSSSDQLSITKESNKSEDSIKEIVASNTTSKDAVKNDTIKQKAVENIKACASLKENHNQNIVKNDSSRDGSSLKKEQMSVKKAPESVNTTIIELPKVPEVPKVITVGGSTYKPRERRNHRLVAPLSMEIPAMYIDSKKGAEPIKEEQKSVKVASVNQDQNIKVPLKEKQINNDNTIGENKNGRVPTYIRGDFISVKEALKNIEGMGCKVLSVNTLDKNKNLTSIVFTNSELEKFANKKDRGFMASLRLLVDKKNNQITISNPLYFARAFMQDDFDDKVVKALLSKIRSTFKNLKNSKENLKYTLLPSYHFMVSMPYYEDMSVVGEADSSEELLKKIKSKNGGSNVVFTQHLSKERILVGVKLGDNIESFIDKVGVKNSLLLPYPVLLQDGEAKILDPKYYIAISYPMLKMSQFMRISDVPGEIEDRCEKLFK